MNQQQQTTNNIHNNNNNIDLVLDIDKYILIIWLN